MTVLTGRTVNCKATAAGSEEWLEVRQADEGKSIIVVARITHTKMSRAQARVFAAHMMNLAKERPA